MENKNQNLMLPVIMTILLFGAISFVTNLALVELSTSSMWGSIFNIAVEGLGKYLAASGIFMVLVYDIIPTLRGRFEGLTSCKTSY